MVPMLNDTAASSSLRSALEQHRDNPACAGCHALFDPIGFGLEHYDGVGAWRDMYPARPIDASGTLPDGSAFDGAVEMANLIKQDPRFPACFARTVFAYAFGREATDTDLAAIGSATADFTARGGKIRDLLTFIASSKSFALRGAQP